MCLFSCWNWSADAKKMRNQRYWDYPPHCWTVLSKYMKNSAENWKNLNMYLREKLSHRRNAEKSETGSHYILIFLWLVSYLLQELSKDFQNSEHQTRQDTSNDVILALGEIYQNLSYLNEMYTSKQYLYFKEMWDMIFILHSYSLMSWILIDRYAAKPEEHIENFPKYIVPRETKETLDNVMNDGLNLLKDIKMEAFKSNDLGESQTQLCIPGGNPSKLLRSVLIDINVSEFYFFWLISSTLQI